MNHREGVGGVLPISELFPKKLIFPSQKGFDKIF